MATVWQEREELYDLNPTPLHKISERRSGKNEHHRLQALSDLDA
jgi:hypothetical protein